MAALLCAIAAGTTAAAEEAAPLTLQRALELAVSANRALTASRLEGEIAQAGIQIARERPNPELSVEVEKETPRESYTLAFPIEMARKRRRRIDVAAAAAGGANAEIARHTAELRVAVRRAYFLLAAAQLRLVEMKEVARLAGRTRDAAQDRFASGEAPRLDLLQADLSRDQADNDLSGSIALMESARIELNTLLALPPDAPTVAAEGLGGGAIPTAPAALDLAMTSSAELSLVERRLVEARARVGLARAQRVPDLVVQGALTRRAQPEFDNGWRAGVAVELPLLSRRRGEVEAAERGVAQILAEREAVAAQIRGGVTAALMVAAAHQERYVRYRDRILPEAEEVQTMAADSYRTGQTGLVTMLQAFAAVRDIRLKSVEAGLDYQNALADLERAIGAPLP